MMSFKRLHSGLPQDEFCPTSSSVAYASELGLVFARRHADLGGDGIGWARWALVEGQLLGVRFNRNCMP